MRIWKRLPKILFSKTLEQVEGDARLATRGAAEEVAELKAQPGKDLAVGGAGLAATLTKLDVRLPRRLPALPARGGMTPR